MKRNYGDKRIVEFDALAAQCKPGSLHGEFWLKKAAMFRAQHEKDAWWSMQPELPCAFS